MVSMILTLEFPANEWFTSNRRMHWAERHRRALLVRKRVRVAGLNAKNTRGLHAPVFRRCHVTAYVAYPTARRFDPSNTSAILKPIIDELTHIGYWIDDDGRHLIGPDYRPAGHKSRTGMHEITLRLEETDATE